MITVQVAKGEHKWRVAVDTPEVSFGRRAVVPEGSVVLPEATISRMHCRVVLRGGKLIIVDFKSTNGTYVNGRRISSPHVLKSGDVVYAGPFKLLFATVADAKASRDGTKAPAWVGSASAEEATAVVRAPPAPPRSAPTSDLEATPPLGREIVRAAAPPPTPSAAARSSPVRAGATGKTVIDDDTALGVVPSTSSPKAR